jgi:CheY-like chemotaxis protein
MNMRPILLADDNVDDQALILRSLKRSNVSNPVLIANDGLEALDYLFGTGVRAAEGPIRPAVVLLDINMPRCNGLDVLERLRSEPGKRTIPVVILTTSDEDVDLIRSYELGVNSYVRKPVDFAEFSTAIAQIGLYWLLINRLPEVA